MPINSVWFWGGGELPSKVRRPGEGIYARDPLVRGLACLAGAAVNPLPDNADDWRAMAEEVVERKFIFVGMATFLTLVPLALTSTKGWIRRLGGRRWNKLHRLVYVAAIGGTVHYLWAVKKDTLFPLVYFALFTLLLGYRAFFMLRDRRARARAAGGEGAPRARRAAAN